MLPLAVSAVLAIWPFSAPPPEPEPEVAIALQSLRQGERARLEQALGSAVDLPLYTGELQVEPRDAVVAGTVRLRFTWRGVPRALRLLPNAAHPGAVTVEQLTVEGVARPGGAGELIPLDVPPSVQVGQRVTVTFKLKAQVPAPPPGSGALGGLGALSGERGGDHGAFSLGDDVGTLSGLVPMLAPLRADGTPRAGPSGVGDLGTFEPSHFLFSVVTPRGWQALSAGSPPGVVPERGGTVRHSFALAAAREFPLVLAREYVKAEAQVGAVTVEAYHPPEDAEAGQRVLSFATESLQLLESRLGPYPYTHLRVVQAVLAGGAGGMEFPGLVTVSRGLYRGPGELGQGGLGSLLAAQLGPLLADTLQFTVAHEVAHQYFGMLVGSDAVDEPVVDEALCQHVALLLVEWRAGKAAADKLRDGQLRTTYQVHRLLGGEDGPANRPSGTFGSTVEYGALVYGKAPFLFDEQRKLVGDATWGKALKAYLAQYRHRWATSRSFTDVVAGLSRGQSGKLWELQKRWWDEAHGDQDLGVADASGLDLGALLGRRGMGLDALKRGLGKDVARQLEEMQKLLEGFLE